MAKSTRTYVQMLLLGLMLVVAPAVSYIYLKRGYDYRVESLSELKGFGNLRQEAGYADPDRRTVDLVYLASAATDTVALALAQLYEAYAMQPDVRFVSLSVNQPNTPIGVRQTDRPDVDPKRAQSAFARASQQDKMCEQVPVTQRALLVDTLGTVRRCYNLHSGKELARIVEQLNILVPRAAEQDIFVRQTEEF